MARATLLRTVVRDCVYLNWALPLRLLPPLPAPLTYEEHSINGEAVAFASALLFRHDRLQVGRWPFLRLSYPQFNLRLYVRDGEGVPAVYFRCILVPAWVVPGARWIARQPVLAGRFDFPRPLTEEGSDPWRWRVRRGAALDLSGSQGMAAPGSGPSLGSWERTVAYFRQRQRGFYLVGGKLRQVKTSHRTVPTRPLRVEIEEQELLAACLPLPAGESWPDLHSAWLCPEIPFVFELDPIAGRERLSRSAAPAAVDPATFAARFTGSPDGPEGGCAGAPGRRQEPVAAERSTLAGAA